MKKNYKFDLTPQIDKQIKEIVRHLPVINRINADGKVITVDRPTCVGFDDLSEEDKKALKINEREYWEDKPWKVDDWRREKRYVKHDFQPVEENHYINLVFAYREFGEQGVENYVGKVNEITRRSEALAQKIKDKQQVKNDPAGEI